MSGTCPICGGAADPTVELYDDRYGCPGRYRLSLCGRCGHRFLDAGLLQGMMSRLYTDYYPRATYNVEQYRPMPPIRQPWGWLEGRRASAYAWVPRNVRVLDVGCGACEALGYHRARGCIVAGVEADGNVAPIARRHGFDVRIGLFADGMYSPESFDVITMDQVLEHMAAPVAALQCAARILKPGGLLIAGTPNANGFGRRLLGARWLHWHAPYHMALFSRRSLRRAARAAGLSVQRILTRTSSEWVFYQLIHLLTRPRPGTPSAFWKDHSLQGTGTVQGFGILLVKVLHRLRLDHLLARALDAMRLGDGFIAVLVKPMPASGLAGRRLRHADE